MAEPTRVVCLGGGWVAIFLVKALRRAIKRGEVELTVVSRENYHTFHGLVPEMLAGRIQPQQLVTPARWLFQPAHFHNAEIREIDVEGRRVITQRAIDDQESVLEYDHAVLALGSIDDLSRFPGIAEHTLRVKTYWNCMKARSQVLTLLEMAELEPDPVERRRLLTFVCVGGNFGGVEVAAELSDYFQALVPTAFPRLSLDDFRIVVVHGGDQILPELGDTQPRLSEYAHEFLEKQGIEFRLNTRLTSATPEEAILNGEERIPTRTILSCAGSAFSPVLDPLPVDRDERGRLKVDEHGRVLGVDALWAAGDCAAMPHPNGGSCPTIVQYAIHGGRLVGRNLLHTLRGQPLDRFTFSGFGEACSIGHRRAVGNVKGLPVWGLPGWLVWRLAILSYVPSWNRKVRIAMDWCLGMFSGRDIANVRMDEPFGVRKELYEPGQPIVREGDVGQRLYVISEGSVDVVRELEDGSEEHLATLGPGQHFGEVAVFNSRRRTATVRARNRVRLLSLGGAEARSLSETMTSFGDRVRALPTDAEDRRSDGAGAGGG